MGANGTKEDPSAWKAGTGWKNVEDKEITKLKRKNSVKKMTHRWKAGPAVLETDKGVTDPDIFISFSKEDLSMIQNLKSQLELSGLKCWMDDLRFETGLLSTPEINTAINSSKVILLCVSPAAASSVRFLLGTGCQESDCCAFATTTTTSSSSNKVAPASATAAAATTAATTEVGAGAVPASVVGKRKRTEGEQDQGNGDDQDGKATSKGLSEPAAKKAKGKQPEKDEEEDECMVVEVPVPTVKRSTRPKSSSASASASYSASASTSTSTSAAASLSQPDSLVVLDDD
mmetsp:Transcript_13450/g.22527  ORF Transcript_13450/g.22527 Transcript_13450/m.22527 type:complete len:288 (-) Transcript_13450:431-1294(-)